MATDSSNFINIVEYLCLQIAIFRGPVPEAEVVFSTTQKKASFQILRNCLP